MNQQGSQQQGKSPTSQPAEPRRTEQMSGEEGRREPIHPDDIGAEGEYLGNESAPKPEGKPGNSGKQ